MRERPSEGWILAGQGAAALALDADVAGMPNVLRLACDLAFAGVKRIVVVWSGPGEPPSWLTDAVAVHLSGFTLQSLAGDFGRTPEDVARVSARVVEASLAAALAAR